MNEGTKENIEGLQGGKTMNHTLRQIVPAIWKARRFIMFLSFGVGFVTLIINYFLLPKYYQAIASLLPQTEKYKLSSLSQFADVAQLAGVDIPGSEVSRLYPALVGSESILQNIIGRKYLTAKYADSVNLIQYFGFADMSSEEGVDQALRTVRGLLSTQYDSRSGVVTVSLEMREPRLASDALNAIVAELDRFMRLKRRTNASEQRAWVEDRLKGVEQELRGSEERLKNFREKNRRVSDSPQLLLEQDRLMRDVQLQSTIFIELKKQNELARIDEIKNISLVNVLDPARPPVKKERPQRVYNTIVMFLLSILLTTSYVVVVSTRGAEMKEFMSLMKRSRGI